MVAVAQEDKSNQRLTTGSMGAITLWGVPVRLHFTFVLSEKLSEFVLLRHAEAQQRAHPA